jgi:hypothetical protein
MNKVNEEIFNNLDSVRSFKSSIHLTEVKEAHKKQIQVKEEKKELERLYQ